MSETTNAEPVPYSREYFLTRLGPELMVDIERRVAQAPAPSPAKVEEIRRLFAAVPLPPSVGNASGTRPTARRPIQ